MDPDIWYPDSDDPQHKQKIKLARSICEGCPVIQECLDYALKNREQYGLWGGLTRRQRDKLRREKNEEHRATSAK